MMEKKALMFGDEEAATKIMTFQSIDLQDNDWYLKQKFFFEF